MIRPFAALLVLFAGTCPAFDTVSMGNGVIAQLVDGAGWKTLITLVNLDDTVSPYTLRFYADDGSPLTLTTTVGTGNSFPGTLPARGTQLIETAGPSQAVLSQGWALVETTSTVGGTAVFREVAAGQPNYEASEPIDTHQDNRFAFPFDHVTDATGLAIANPLDSSASIFITFRDENGTSFVFDNFQVPPLGHIAFTMTTRYPQTIGRRGSFEISTGSLWVNLLGLRFSPSGVFSSVTPLVSWKW
jgi:hypothetical protein